MGTFKINKSKQQFKSVSELAEYIGVTRKTLYERAKANKIILSGNYNEAQMDILRSRRKVKKKTEQNNQKETKPLNSIQAENQFLKNQINNKDKEIAMLNNHIKQSHILINQAQQLQLMAEKKIATLEAPKQAEDDVYQDKDSPVSSVQKGQKKDPSVNQKRGVWHKLFK